MSIGICLPPVTIISVPVLEGCKLREDVEIPSGLQILEDGPIPAHHHCFSIIDPDKGDERLTWDNRSLPSIADAKKAFVNLVLAGLKPFKVGLNGIATSDAMSEFDPLAEEVIFLPMAPVGGG
jgi:hypothetical protein